MFFLVRDPLQLFKLLDTFFFPGPGDFGVFVLGSRLAKLLRGPLLLAIFDFDRFADLFRQVFLKFGLFRLLQFPDIFCGGE